MVRFFLRSGRLCGAGLRVALYARNSRFDLRLRFELRIINSQPQSVLRFRVDLLVFDAFFLPTLNSICVKEGVFFLQAPCISQAPFHVPSRGGYQGGARLSKMDCSDTTQSLQVSLEGRFKKSFLGLNAGDQEVEELSLVSPQNTSS